MLRRSLSICLFTALTLLAAGCNSSSGNGNGGTSSVPVIVFTASSLAFPTTAAGQTSAALTATVTNTGSGTATLGAYALSGDTADFNIAQGACGTTLAAGANCVLSLTFAPVAAGSFSLTISVTDNAAGSPQSITFTGTGTATPLATLSASAITFPSTSSGTTAAPLGVTLTNSGNATLTITNVALGGANSAVFANFTTCATTLPAGTSCNISATFTPTAVSTTYNATVTITDNANNIAGTTQTIALSGTSPSASPTPVATLSATSIAFATTFAGTTTAAQSVTLTNTGTLTLNIGSIVLSGTNAANFAITANTCTATLTASSVCTISATFSPAAAATASYAATITLTDNSASIANSTQTIALTGSGTTSTVTHTLYVFPEADNSATPLYALVNAATKTIDMTMYALQDATFTADLTNACKRGVTVRVILDQNNEKSADTPDFNLINAQTGCTAVWANKAFSVTHEKSFIVDGTTLAILSLNLQSGYYSTTRDYAIVENDTNDIAAVQATFNMDYAAGTTAAGVVGASDFSYLPQSGTDLVWSPTTATTDMLAIINNATKTLYIECEEFGASNIVSAVAAAASRGVTVVLIGENEGGSYNTNYTTIKTAGASVYYYSSSTGFYVHAKAVVADQGLATEAVYMGSINYSTASLTMNRELGVYITGNTAVSNPLAITLKATILSDENQPGVTKF